MIVVFIAALSDACSSRLRAVAGCELSRLTDVVSVVLLGVDVISDVAVQGATVRRYPRRRVAASRAVAAALTVPNQSTEFSVPPAR